MGIRIVELTDADIAFGAHADEIMPSMEKIPEVFRKHARTPQSQLFNEWFYAGIVGLRVTPRPGVDPNKALRMIRCIMGSFMPAHEHKEAAVAYMLHEFFARIEYAKKNEPEKTIVIEDK